MVPLAPHIESLAEDGMPPLHTGSNPVLTTKNKIIINMKKYHLTILRNGEYVTIFGEMSSIENFLLIEKELGYDTHILYSREL